MKLKYKLIFLTAGLSAGLVLSVLLVIHQVWFNTMLARAEKDIEMTRATFDQMVKKQLESYIVQGKIMAHNTQFMESFTRNAVSEIRAFLESVRDQVPSTYILAIDKTGRILVDLDERYEEGSRYPLPDEILTSGEDLEGWWLLDDWLIHVALVRVKSANKLIGSILLGDVVVPSKLGDLQSMTRCDISIFTSSGDKISTTTPLMANNIHEKVKTGTASMSHATIQIEVDQAAFMCSSAAFHDISGKPIGWITLSRSMAEPIAAMKHLQTILLLIGGGAITLAFLTSMFVAHRVVKPIEAVIRGSRRIQEGHLDYRVGLSRRDEVGQLARAFDAMAASLKTSYTEIVKQKNFAENVLSTMADSLLVIDADGKVKTANQASIRILDRPAPELLGQYVQEIVRDKMGPLDYQRLYKLTSASALTEHEAELLPKEKGPVPITLSAARLVEDQNDLLGYVLSAKDIRESLLLKQVQAAHAALVATQEQLVQSEKLAGLGQLMGGIAHELNNPLAGVLGFAQLLLRSNPDPRTKRDLERIFSEAERCRKIIENLLRFSRKDEGETAMTRVNDVINKTIDLIVYELKVADIQVRTEFDATLPETEARPFQLQQVFLNLITNARDAMPEGGELRITTQCKQNVIRIEFIDTGSGIKPEHLKKIFDPFFTTKEVGKGTGLGLSVAYGIIKSHNGDIWAESEIGHGSRFIITLPVKEGAARKRETTAVASLAKPSTKSRKVLVVDDEEMLLEIWKELLKEGPFQVDAVSQGAQAIELLKKNEYDLVISDVKMPTVGGQDIYRFIHDNKPGLQSKILFVTGDAISPETSEFLKSHNLYYLTKPFDLNQARKRVETIIAS